MPTIHSLAESGGLSDVFVLRLAEFLGESDEKPFRPANVAEPVRVFILDYVAYELRAELAELLKAEPGSEGLELAGDSAEEVDVPTCRTDGRDREHFRRMRGLHPGLGRFSR